jgi:flagellar basal body rod protein FlgB
MPFGFIDRVSNAAGLKDGLDVSTQRTRMLADRVSQASLQRPDSFALPRAGAKPGSPEAGAVDLEAEMVSLADEQIRYETTAKLLEKTYLRLRSVIKD